MTVSKFRNSMIAVAALFAVFAVLSLGTPPVEAAPAQAAEALTPDQKKAVEGVIKEYLHKNPDVLLDAMRALRERQQQAEETRARDALSSLRGQLENNPDSPVMGNPKGDVTLVEFFDYRCPYCKKVHPGLRKLMKEDKNIRFVQKEWPILGPDSDIAARAALAVYYATPARYPAYQDAMMTARGKLTAKRVYEIAAKLGLDVKKMKAGMKSPRVNMEIERNSRAAQALNITGTPAFIVGEHVIPGAVDITTLKGVIATLRKK